MQSRLLQRVLRWFPKSSTSTSINQINGLTCQDFVSLSLGGVKTFLLIS